MRDPGMTRRALLIAAAAAPGVLRAQTADIDLLAKGDLSDWVEEFHPRHRERAARENLTAFALRDGILHVDGSLGNVGFLRHKATFCDFDFRCEFRAPQGTNNGVCFRAPAYDKETPAHTGYELQLILREGLDPIQTTGALYSVTPPLTRVSLKPSEWNDVRVHAQGTRIQAWINGVQVQDFRQDQHDTTRNRPHCGHFFVQSHGGDAEFRNMRVRVLA